MSDNTGEFVWYELLTTDTSAAKAFYGETIGWGTQPFEGSGAEPYEVWTVGGKPLGGLMTLPEQARQMGAPPHWLAYVGVDDVDASAARVLELGGKLYVQPTTIAEVGRFSVFADPQGAVQALFTPLRKEAAERPKKMTPGTFSWHELMTSDAAAAWSFYQALFGWQKTDAMDLSGGGIYQMYGKGGRTFGGMMRKPAEMNGPPAWLYYTVVGDLDATVQQVKARGGRLLNGPMEVPGGDRVAQCMDPQGAAFAIHWCRAQ